MNKAEKLAILDDLIRLETVNGHEKQVADYLQALFTAHKIHTELHAYAPDRVNLIATLAKGDGPILGFTGHQDVVAPVAADEWTYGPFNPKHHDGKIFGRGTSDMKSGLAGLAIAMIELSQDPNFHGNIKFLATVGEELGELGAQKLAADGYVNDVHALVVGEPSNASADIVLKKLMGSGLIQLPAQQPEHYGRHSFFCAHKGSIVYKIIARGKAAHSSMPEVGINALDNLVTFYNAQKAYFETITQYSDDILGRTTPAITILNAGDQDNTIPDYAEMTVKIRTIPEYNNDRLTKDIQALITKLQAQDPKMNLEMIETSSNWPVKTDLNSKFLKLVHESYQAT